MLIMHCLQKFNQNFSISSIQILHSSTDRPKVISSIIYVLITIEHIFLGIALSKYIIIIEIINYNFNFLDFHDQIKFIRIYIL